MSEVELRDTGNATINPLSIANVPPSRGQDVIPSIGDNGDAAGGPDDLGNRERESSFVGHEIEIPKNSARTSVFLLVNTMIGSGILTMPFVFKSMGILGTIPCFLVSATAMWYSMVILADVGLAKGMLDYSELATLALGHLGEQIVDVSIIMTGFGAILSYILVIGELLSGLLIDWGCESDFCELSSTIAWVVVIFVTPTCLQRHFGHLAYVSVFSICAITLVLSLVIIGGPVVGHKEGFSSRHLTLLDGHGMLQSIGSIIFALNCIAAVLHGLSSTEDKSRNVAGWRGISFWANLIGAVMLFSMGLAGYLSFRDETNGEILTNFTAPGFAFFKCMVIVHLVAYIPIDFVVMRYSVVKLFLGVNAENLATVYHVSLTLFLLIVAMVTVLCLVATGTASGDLFAHILDFTGGVAGGLGSFIMPGIIYLKLMPETAEFYTAAKSIIVFGVAISISVLTGTALNAAGK
jgi:amino acid permease